VYRDAVEGYIREVEPLLAQTETGRHYWQDKLFGTAEIRPSDGMPAGAEIIESREDQTVAIRGLGSLFKFSENAQTTVELQVPSNRRGKKYYYEEVPANVVITLETLDQMYSGVNSFLAEIGLDVEVSKAQENTKLDDDLLDEVAEWRNENL